MADLFDQLPPALDFGWTPRTVGSADVVRTALGDGRREIRIDHAPLTGVTTAMLGWWFQHFGGIARYRGRDLPAYRLWHPADHIDVHPGRDGQGRVAPGQRLHIREVFGRDRRFAADIHAVIHRWDQRGIGFHHDVLGHRVVELDHVFSDTAEGVLYRTCMRVGAGTGPLKGPINRIVTGRRFTDETAGFWLRHNIEEVGFFTDFLPELFEARAISPTAGPPRR